MSVGLGDDDGISPGLPVGPGPSAVSPYDLQGIDTDYRIASAILSDIESELAIDIAGCLQGAMSCDDICRQCISGLLEQSVKSAEDSLSKANGRVEKDVQSFLSTAISAATMAGVPITDMVLIDGQPITIDGQPNQIQADANTDITVQICPNGTVPVTTADNRIECVDPTTTENLPTTPVEVKGGQKGAGEGKTVEASVPVNVPIAPVNQPLIPQGFQPPAGFVPGQVKQTDPNNYQILGTVGGRPYICYFDNKTGFPPNTLCFSLDDGTTPVDPTEPPAEPPKTIEPSGPPSTGGTGPTETVAVVEPQPKRTHPFCDPDDLYVDDIAPLSKPPSEVFTSKKLTTLGADLSTILTQPSGNNAMDALTNILGTPIVVGGYGIDFVINGLATIGSNLSSFAAKGFAEMLGAASTIAGPLLSSGPCQSEPFTSLAVTNFIPSILGFFGGAIPTQITVPNTYAMNYLCPVLIPTGSELNAMRSKGIISDSQWRIGVKANNLCPEWQERIVDGIRTIPTPDQIQVAWRRGIIDDDAYDYYMKRNGILREDDANIWFRLSEFVPGPSDLIRFMVRDAFDDSLETNKLADAEFPTKFTERAKQWARDQGMSDDVFKFFWRSHYVYPSNTQLYEMLHRLREDQTNADGSISARKVTKEDIRRVLQINDSSPEWVDRLISISYRPLTRVDARRAYEIGEITEEELRNSFLDLGYSPEDSERLLKFSKATSGPIRAKRLGHPSTAEVIGWYKEGLVPVDQAEEQLVNSGIPRSSVTRYLDTADIRRTTAYRKRAINYLRKRYLMGEFSNSEATFALREAAIPSERIGEILQQWEREKNAKSKQPTVGMLCDWWTRGYITMSEFIRRCENLGYSLVDAERIVASCQGKEAERRQKESERLAKEAESRQRRIESENRRRLSDIKKVQKETERLIKEAAPCKPPPKPTCEVNGTT